MWVPSLRPANAIRPLCATGRTGKADQDFGRRLAAISQEESRHLTAICRWRTAASLPTMRRRFVAVGDSFTEGVGDPNPLYPNGVRGWADRMARQLGRYDDRWLYANLAIRSKYLREVAAEQIDDALALRPTLLSFYAGGNDILTARVNMAELMDLYAATIDRLGTSGAQLILFTAYDATRGPILEPVRRRIAFYNNGVRDIARATNAILIDHERLPEFADRRL